MLKKLALAGTLALVLAIAALAANAPMYKDPAGTNRDAQGVVLIDTTGQPYTTTGGASGLSLTDASIASASGASQTVAAASASRKALIIANPSATTWWINPSGGTAAANCAGCFELPAGAYWSPRPAPTNIVTGIGTAASKLTVTGG